MQRSISPWERCRVLFKSWKLGWTNLNLTYRRSGNGQLLIWVGFRGRCCLLFFKGWVFLKDRQQSSRGEQTLELSVDDDCSGEYVCNMFRPQTMCLPWSEEVRSEGYVVDDLQLPTLESKRQLIVRCCASHFKAALTTISRASSISGRIGWALRYVSNALRDWMYIRSKFCVKIMFSDQ